MDKTSPCTARAARCGRADAFRQVTTAVVPLPPHAAMEATPVVAHGRRNGTIAPSSMLTWRSSFRLLAIASPYWMIYGTY